MNYRLPKKRKNVMKSSVLIFPSLIFMLLTILLSIVIVGIIKPSAKGDKNNINVEKYKVEPNDIVFDDKNGGPKIKVYITSENKIVEMNLEEYVRGVVSGEMPAEFNLEALKAQAVAARTFGLAHMEGYGGHPYNGAKGADVTDTVECQVYMSKDKRLASWDENKKGEYWNKITKAVMDTEGQILTYDNKLVLNPYFFSTSGGKTEDSKDVFSFDEPYLKSVISKGDEKSPRFINKYEFTYADFIKKVNSSIQGTGLTEKNLSGAVKVLKRSSNGGTVKEIQLGNKTMSGTDFRWTLGLSSYNYEIKFVKNKVTVKSYGYGHDVGMSQWGANEMGKAGKNYKEILTYYYTGVKLQKLNY